MNNCIVVKDGKRRKKIFIFTILILSVFSLSAKPKILCDFGELAITGVFNDVDSSFKPTLILPEMYVVGEKTALFASISPFEMQFKYQLSDYKHEGYTQNWALSDISFFNANFGWLKQLNNHFLLETYVRMNALSAFDIKRFVFKPVVEISWTSPLIDEIINPEKYIFIPKVLSLQVGAAFENTNNFKPAFFVTASMDVTVLVGLISVLGRM